MRSSHALSVAFVLVITGCSSRAAPPKSVVRGPTTVTVTGPFALPIARAANPTDEVPLSIRRILAEQHSELHDVLALTAPIPDVRGRARATTEATALASELGEIENALAAAGADSERYDQTVVRLQRLATRVELLHDALRGAVSSTTALEVDVNR